MTDTAQAYRATDDEYNDSVLIDVTPWSTTPADPEEDAGEGSRLPGYNFTMETGWNVSGTPEEALPFEPQIGDTLRLYGRQFGSVRGMEILRADAPPCVFFYRTPDEDQAKHDAWGEAEDQKKRDALAANLAERDAQYDALPEVFRARIDKYRANNPDFRWQYEPYEMFVCEQAIVIFGWMVEAARKTCGAVIRPGEFTDAQANDLLDYFHKMPVEWQKKQGLDDGHSGNTFGAACALARLYAIGGKTPDGAPWVVALAGAMTPLVGSEEYGDVPRGTVMEGDDEPLDPDDGIED